MAHLCGVRVGAHAGAGPADFGLDAAHAPAGLSGDGRAGGAGRHRPAVADRCQLAGVCRAGRSGDDHRHDAAGAAGLDRDPDRGHRTGGEPMARRPSRHARRDSGRQPARLDPRALLQRAAGHGDGDAGCAGAPRLRQFRSHRAGQQHAGRGDLGAGPGALRGAGRAVPLLPLRRHGRVQGRGAQRGASADRSRNGLCRGDRQRLPGRTVLAAPGAAVLRRARNRPGPGAAGLPRRARKHLQGDGL